jgi:hypothetical protein
MTFKIALTSRVFTKNHLKEVTGTGTSFKHKLNYIEGYTKGKQRDIPVRVSYTLPITI